MKKHVAEYIFLALTCLFIVVFYFGEGFWQKKWMMGTAELASSQTGHGLRVFSNLAQLIQPGSFESYRKPILQARDLNSIRTFMILSPSTSVSPREAKLIADHVKAGHKLVIGLNSPAALARVESLLRALEIRLTMNSNADFKNFKPIEIENDATGFFLIPGERYHFYSLFVLSEPGKGSDCRLSPIFCYWREYQTGSGTTVIFSGVSPVSNALIQRGDNRALAFRLIRSVGAQESGQTQGRLVLDEYRLMMTEKSFGDLWTDPSFALPIVGFVLMALAYFFFAYSPINDNRPSAKVFEEPVRSFHKINQEILAASMIKSRRLSDFIPAHLTFLKRRLPSETQTIDKIGQKLRPETPAMEQAQVALQLVNLHRKILKLKGRKSK